MEDQGQRDTERGSSMEHGPEEGVKGLDHGRWLRNVRSEEIDFPSRSPERRCPEKHTIPETVKMHLD